MATADEKLKAWSAGRSADDKLAAWTATVRKPDKASESFRPLMAQKALESPSLPLAVKRSLEPKAAPASKSSNGAGVRAASSYLTGGASTPATPYGAGLQAQMSKDREQTATPQVREQETTPDPTAQRNQAVLRQGYQVAKDYQNAQRLAKKYQKQAEEYQRLTQLDIGAAEKRVAELKAAAVDAKAAHTAVDADPKYTYWDGVYESAEAANAAYLADSNAAWETRKKIDDELAALNQDIESAKLVQYAMTPTRDDFEVYAARGGAMKNNVVKTVREMNPQMRSALEQRRIPFPDQPGLTYDHLAYARLTDQEARIYNYLLAKDNDRGTNYASEYLSFMMEPMKAREGREMADAVKNSGIFRPVLTAGQGIISGAESFVNGVQQAFSREQLPTSANQFASAYIQDDLKDVGPKFSGRSLGQIGYGAAELAGGLAPRVALGAIHPVLGIASGSVSTYGNTYGQALAQGYSEDQARSYATIRAAIDGTLQYVAGGFPQLGGGVTEKVASRVVEHIDHAALRVAADVGIHGLAQGTRDYLMTTLDPALRNWLLDEDNDVKLLTEDNAYAFLSGFFIAGAMRIPGAIRTERNRPGTALAVRKFGPDMPNYLTEDGTDYFDGVEDEAGARARYRDLARKNHPDMGGSEAVMKEINRQYEMRVNYYKGQAAGAQAAAAWKDPARSGAQGPIAQPNAGESASGMGLMLPGGSLPAQSSMGVPGPILLGPGVTTAPNGPVLDSKTSPVAMLPETGMTTIEDAEAPSTAIDTNPATHTPEQMALIKAYQGAVDEGLVQFYKAAKNGEKIAPYRMKPVSDRAATVIKKLLEKDVAGFATIFEPRIAEHINRDHGEQGKADHSMKDPMDVARMQFVLDNFDSAVDGGTTDAYWEPAGNGKNRRARTIVFSKKVNGTYYVVEAAPITKAQSVYIVSAYMSKAGTPHPTDATAPVFTAQPENVNVPASSVIIPQPPTGVNLQPALPGDIPADIPPGLRKLYLLAQEMSASPPPREIPQRPVQQSPQEILSQLAREMARDSLQGGALDGLSNEDIVDILDKISPTGEGLQSTPFEDIMSQKEEDSDGSEERAESSQDFRQRSLSEGLTVFEGDAAIYGYRRASDTDQRAGQVQEELKRLGIPADITDGLVWRNKDGITKRLKISEAATVGGKTVLINGSISLPSKCVAGHEGFHYWKGTPARQKYVETLRDNLNFSSNEFLQYQSTIAKAYLGEEIDLTDSKQLRALEEELFAYISGDFHEGDNDAALRPMFRDFDAVKRAWEQLVKLNAAPGKTLKTPGQEAEGGQDVLFQLTREVAQAPAQGSALDGLSDEDIRAMLEEIARRQSGETTSKLPEQSKSQPQPLQSELLSTEEDGTIVSGAISGALNPTGKRAKKHAKRYYGLIRKMKTDVARIAKNTGYKADQIQKIKQYLFFDSHILAGGKFERFTPDFDMAQSWKRLLEGADIKQHDLTLLKHEIMEMALVESGMSQDEAHRKTSAIYNYAKEAEEYNDTIKRYKD